MVLPQLFGAVRTDLQAERFPLSASLRQRLVVSLDAGIRGWKIVHAPSRTLVIAAEYTKFGVFWDNQRAQRWQAPGVHVTPPLVHVLQCALVEQNSVRNRMRWSYNAEWVRVSAFDMRHPARIFGLCPAK